MMDKVRSGLMSPGVVLRSHETSLEVTADKYTSKAFEFLLNGKRDAYDSFGKRGSYFF